MPLKDQVIPAKLQAGVDTGKDPKLVSQGMLILENMVMDKQGELSKRTGLSSLDSTHANDNLATYKDRAMTVGATVARHDGVTSAVGGFDSLGNAGGMDVEVSARAGQSLTTAIGGEVQEAGRLQAITWGEVDNVAVTYSYKLAVYDRYSGVLIDEIEDDFQIRILNINDTIYYFKPSAADSPIEYSRVDSDGTINTSMQTITGCSNTETDAIGACLFAVAVVNDSTGDAMLVHALQGLGGIQICGWEDPGFGSGTWAEASDTGPTTIADVAVSRFADGTALVSYIDSGVSPRLVVCEGFNVATASVVSAVTVFSNTGTDTFDSVVTVRMTDTQSRVYSTRSAAVENGAVVAWNTFINTAGTGSATFAANLKSVWGVGIRPVAQPFEASDGKHYTLFQRNGYATSADDVNWAYLIYDEDAVLIARIMPGYAYSISNAVGPVHARSTGEWVMAGIKRTDGDTTAVAILEVTFDPGQVHSVETPEHLMVAGSSPWEVDGQQVVEQGFPWYPFTMTLTRAAPGAATDIGIGVYGYKYLYEWFDNQGARHQSRPSPTYQVTTTDAEDVVTLADLASLWNTYKEDVVLVLFRTAVDGSHYYRLKSLANDTTDRSQSTTDSVGDSSITSNEELYTAGGIVANTAPPPFRVHCTHQSRHFVVNREAETWDIRYSKPFTNDVGVQHSGLLTLKCETAGGRITGLHSFGDRLIIFKANRIYATNGYGRSLDASGQGYREPYLVSESIGCANQKTIVETPAGLLFEAADGIYALDKTMRVQAIGEPVRYHYDQVTLTSGAIVTDKHYAIWTSSDGVALVFDYLHGQWLEFTNHESSDATVAQGILYIKTASGDLVKAENRSVYLDDYDQVAIRIRTGWFSFAGLAGFKRVRDVILIGQSVTGCKIRVKTAYDFDPVWVDTQTFDLTDFGYFNGPASHYAAFLATTYLDKSMLLNLATSRQKSTAIMLEISDESGVDDNDWEDLFEDARVGEDWTQVPNAGTITEVSGYLREEADSGDSKWEADHDTPVHAHHTFEAMDLSGAGLYTLEAGLEMSLSTTGGCAGLGLFADLENAWCCEMFSAGAEVTSHLPRVYSVASAVFTTGTDDVGTSDASPLLRVYWNSGPSAVTVVNSDELAAGAVRAYISRDAGTTWTAVAAAETLAITPTGIVLYARVTSGDTFQQDWEYAKVTLTGPEPTQSFTLSGLSFLVALKKGQKRLGSGREF